MKGCCGFDIAAVLATVRDVWVEKGAHLSESINFRLKSNKYPGEKLQSDDGGHPNCFPPIRCT